MPLICQEDQILFSVAERKSYLHMDVFGMDITVQQEKTNHRLIFSIGNLSSPETNSEMPKTKLR